MSSLVASSATAAVRVARPRAASSTTHRPRSGMPAFGPRPSASTALSRRVPPPLAAKPKEKDVDWDAKTKQMTAERIMDACLEAMADGDEGRLEACLLELEDEGERAGVIDSLQKTPQVKDDKFWQEKLQEIAAERVLDNCMAAVVRSPRLVPRPRAPKPARVPHEPPAYLFLHLPRYFPTTSTPLARDGGG